MKKFIASYPREFAVQQRFFSFNYFEAEQLKNPKNATGFVMKKTTLILNSILFSFEIRNKPEANQTSLNMS